MTPFKRFINEASTFDISKYMPPQPRSKFQLGDIVVVFGDQRWSMYQPIRSNHFIGQIGRVEAYKPASMSSPKYAVRLKDGQIEGIVAAYLLGPFKDEAAAAKYQKVGLSKFYQAQPKVKVEDLKGFSGNTVVQRNEKFENKAREIFTNSPFNFNWPENPLVFKSTDASNKSATIIGFIPKSSTPFKDLKMENLNDSYVRFEVHNKDFFNFLNHNFCIFRINNDLKGTLKSWNANGAYGTEYGFSPYAVNLPRIAPEYLNSSYSAEPVLLPWDKDFFSSLKKEKDIFSLKISNLPLSIVGKPDILISTYNLALGFYHKKIDPEAAFNIMFGVEKMGNDLMVTRRVNIFQKDQDKFLNLLFKAGNTYEVECTDGNNIKIPPSVTNVDLKTKKNGNPIVLKSLSIFKNTNVTTIDITNFDIQNLSGLSDTFERLVLDECIIKNLNGLPKNIDSLELTGPGVESLDGGENTTCRFISIKDTKFTKLNQLENIPEAQFYKLNQALEDIPNIRTKIDKMVENRKIVSKMKPKTREKFGRAFLGL